MTKVGIYSGTFDPIHKGHLSLAEAALQKGLVDVVYFMVEPNPRRKDPESVLDLSHRLNMVWLATQGNPFFEVLPLEQEVFDVGSTLPWLKKRFDNMALLMGSDTAAHLHTWPGYATLKQEMDFIVGQREGSELELGDLFDAEILNTGSGHVAASVIRKSPNDHKDHVSPEVRQYIVSRKLYS